MTHPDTLAALRDRADTQAETIVQLRAALAPVEDFSRVGRFTPQESTILSLLLRRETATFCQIHQALYAGRSADAPGGNGIVVHVCRIRMKLRTIGVAVANAYALGYRMPPESKAVLRTLMAGVGA